MFFTGTKIQYVYIRKRIHLLLYTHYTPVNTGVNNLHYSHSLLSYLFTINALDIILTCCKSIS